MPPLPPLAVSIWKDDDDDDDLVVHGARKQAEEADDDNFPDDFSDDDSEQFFAPVEKAGVHHDGRPRRPPDLIVRDPYDDVDFLHVILPIIVAVVSWVLLTACLWNI